MSVGRRVPFTMGGKAARVIRMRFPEEQIAMLLEMAWWDWPLERIAAGMKLICAGDVAALHAF